MENATAPTGQQSTEQQPANQQPQQTAPGQQPPQQPQQPQTIATPNIQDGVDLTQWYAKARREINDKAAQKQNSFLLETFGTSDPEEIAKISQTVKQTTGKPPIDDVLKSLQDTNSKIESLEKNHNNLQLENKMIRDVKNARDVDLVLYAAKSRYDFRDENGQIKAYVKGSDDPVIDAAKAKQKTFADIVAEMQIDQQTAGLFQTTSNLKQPVNGSPEGSKPGFGMATREQRTSPKFLKAVKASGQWHEMNGGKEIDLDAVKAEM